LAYLFL